MPACAQQFDEGLPAAVEDGHFQVVDFDVRVVDAQAVEGAEQMFGGGDQHALAHQAGGVADAGDVAPAGGDGEIVEIGAAENDSGAGGAGVSRMLTGTPLMQADAGGFDGSLESGFKAQDIEVSSPL